MRNTRQKELLSEEIIKFKTFFTAEEFFDKTSKKDSRLGIATVYRFLNDLENKRQIHSYICNRKKLYSLNHKSHCHFICEKCSKIEHIEINSLDFLKNKISGMGSMCHFQIDVIGICNNCKEK